jgi:SAM-dependent methyltransferase
MTPAACPSPPSQFAVVACLEALEFLPAPEAALIELLRVVQPGGLLVTTNRVGRDAALLPGRIFSRRSPGRSVAHPWRDRRRDHALAAGL